MKKIKLISIFILIIYFALLITSRSPLIIDDIHPQYSCPNLIEKSDILYITPLFNGDSLLNHPEWCQEIKTMNKTLALHGINHNYHEFLEPITAEQLEEALTIFESCFNTTPKLFRPPYNKISSENKALVDHYGMTVYKTTYILHPYCHCQPQGLMKFLNQIIGC